MEELILNQHNKVEYPPMHTADFNTSLIKCLCIGQHVQNTSEIGTFKLLSHNYNPETCIWRIRFKLIDK